ncbi:hypothetical protein NKJ26_22760 [Mesorhizobium sp. M0152]|uniref:hypothetical protein n=1 Tax=Mesorhizobium sp. M0152 TaxID=2956898 RepID=UPI003339C74E
MIAMQDATRTIAAEQLVFSGPLLLACLAVAAPGRPRFTDVSVRAGAQFRLAHPWGGQIVSGVAINFVAAGSATILGQVPAGRAAGVPGSFSNFLDPASTRIACACWTN